MKDPAGVDATCDQMAIVKEILQRHVPHLTVWAFGSRTRNTAKKFSDLDLAILTQDPLGLEIHAALVDDFSTSDLPWKVDIVDWALTDEAFRDVIQQHYIVVQEVSSEQAP